MSALSAPTLIRQIEPLIRLFLSDGSERSDYLPQARALALLGRPHAGINLMACYYPKQSFWPERRLFSADVPHYRHAPKDETATTKMAEFNEWTDGYYNLDLDDPRNVVVQQMEDVRRHGQDVRLTLTADIDTTDEELRRIAETLKPFGRVELRLNHEANGNNWFRFAQNAGIKSGPEQVALYHAISQFFIRAERVIRAAAPELRLVGCYNGPGERTLKGELAPGEMPHLGDDELGLMYDNPDTLVSLDQYGSLHYGWPGHTITDAPVIDGCTHAKHQSFSLTSADLCEMVIRPFQQFIEQKRGVPTRIDLGELDFDEDIHGPEIRAHLLYECYAWVRRNPQAIGSVTFYEITDLGGLGLYRQKAYGDLERIEANVVTDLYKRVLGWDEFRPNTAAAGAVSADAKTVELRWTTSSDALGLELPLAAGQTLLDLGAAYWKRVVFVDASGAETFVHDEARKLPVPAGAVKARVFALPPDGRDNAPAGYVRSVPVPR